MNVPPWGYDLIPLAGARSEDPVVADEVEAGRRYERGEPLQELEGLEDNVRRAVAPAVFEAVEEAAVPHA
jgi:hypothetical protein